MNTDTFTINDLALDPGLNTLNVSAIDKAGNTSQANIDITLDTSASAVYNYDLDGNLISNSLQGTTWNYNWDAENKLIKACSSLGKTIDYVYYADGNLGSRTVQDTTKYIYDGIHCIAKYNTSNQLINEIVYGPQIDEVLCSIDSSDTAHYYHQDALQSVTVITDGSANKSAEYEYDVYGKIKDKTGTFKNEITYTGRWLDEDTGLHYYRARWYDADNGRFISRDPIGFMGGVNFYGYCYNNSVNYVDPLGLLGQEAVKEQLDKHIGDRLSEDDKNVIAEFTSRQIGVLNLPGLLKNDPKALEALEARVRKALQKADDRIKKIFEELEKIKKELENKNCE